MSEKKPFAKLRNLVVASTIAVGALMSTGCSSCCDSGPAKCADPCETSWDYTHGGGHKCGGHSCGGRD